MDTAGIDGSRIGSNNDEVMQQMMHQSWQAAQAADVILLMLDARLGVTTSVDWMETAQWLRKMTDHNPKVVVLANKLEGDAWDYHGSPVLDNIEEMSRVGFGEPILLSAIHGDGMAELAVVLEELEAEKRERLGMPPKDENEEDEDDLELLGDDKPLQLAILGRQNVGKVRIHAYILHITRCTSVAACIVPNFLTHKHTYTHALSRCLLLHYKHRVPSSMPCWKKNESLLDRLQV